MMRKAGLILALVFLAAFAFVVRADALTGVRRSLIAVPRVAATLAGPVYPVLASPAPIALWRMGDSSPSISGNPATGGQGFAEYSGGTALSYISNSGGSAHAASITSHAGYSWRYHYELFETPQGASTAGVSATQPFTISFFYQPAVADGNYNVFMSQGPNAPASNTGWLLYGSGSGSVLNLLVGAGTYSTTLISGGVDPAVGTTVYITVTYNPFASGLWTLDENGVQIGSGYATLSTQTAYPWVQFLNKGTSGSPANAQNGYIQDIRVWSTPLTTAQDLANYNAGK